MAQVTKNPNQTYTVGLSAKEHRALDRLGTEQSLTDTKCLEKHLTDWLKTAQTDFLAADWPAKQPKYDALAVQKQDQVDRILAGG